MTRVEHAIARHYTHGSLERAILTGLEVGRAQSPSLIVDQLSAIDEFHLGGRAATDTIAEQLALAAGMKVLDVGCGIGGTARRLASCFGCRITGVDVTPEYVKCGNDLNRRVGLDRKIELKLASGTELPAEDASFDRATLIHVGMNVPDKRRLFAEIGRVLKPGGILGVYDVMRTGEAPVIFPVPWAQSLATSFLATPLVYRHALNATGFDITTERNWRQLALEFFRAISRRAVEKRLPPLGVHILMGADAAIKVANTLKNLERESISPILLMARRR